MKDARWQDVLLAVRATARHFAAASSIIKRDDFDDREESGYVNLMAFFHAMQSGHTALEEALLRVLQIIGEDEPTGQSWHAELISRCTEEANGRPSILSRELASAAQQTRGFRHRATHATVRFDFVFSKDRAQVAALAGDKIGAEFEPAILAFADIVDPD
ncbi:MAG: hypothetical protein M3453_02425 [Pseudomonadota bacterium]|nr:hypothetical protein [Pseudomonadota bacterium]